MSNTIVPVRYATLLDAGVELSRASTADNAAHALPHIVRAAQMLDAVQERLLGTPYDPDTDEDVCTGTFAGRVAVWKIVSDEIAHTLPRPEPLINEGWRLWCAAVYSTRHDHEKEFGTTTHDIDLPGLYGT